MPLALYEIKIIRESTKGHQFAFVSSRQVVPRVREAAALGPPFFFVTMRLSETARVASAIDDVVRNLERLVDQGRNHFT